jgi:tRNA(Ile)-lysidine synthase
MLDQLSNGMLKQGGCRPGEKVLVGISGGPDSVALAHGLQGLGYAIGLAHVNYQLRGEESEAEEALVRQYAKTWNVPVYVLRKKTSSQAGGDSLQVEARNLRYAFFEEIMEDKGYAYCALAHQADDQAEQILMSLLRGNDEAVLRGIPPQRGPYIRPLLEVPRTDILAYLRQHGLAYAEDSSNAKNVYLRNQVRNLLRPALQGIHPHADRQLRQRFAWYQQQKALLDQVLDELLQLCCPPSETEGLYRLDWRPFVEKRGADQLELLVAHCLKGWGWHGHLLWEGCRLIEAQAGKKVEGPMGELIREKHGLVFLPIPIPPMQPVSITSRQLRAGPVRVSWYEKQVVLRMMEEKEQPFFGLPDLFFLDWETIDFPLQLRNWQEGDRMRPFGLGGSKKLSDIFKDEAYSQAARRKALVLVDRKKILLLSGYRIAEEVKLTANTRHVVRVEILNDDA